MGDVQQKRSVLEHTQFIAITGSCGKTTTSNLAEQLLSPSLSGSTSPADGNCGEKLVSHIMQVGREDRYCIQELGAWGPGTLDHGLEIVAPDIGVVLNVRNDHYSGFRGLINTQAEKSKVVKCLPYGGCAILNEDDALVRQMKDWTRASVITFGTSPRAILRAKNVRASWPKRLSFDLLYHGKTLPVQTQLVAEHLVGSALAAIGIALAMGIPLNVAVERLTSASASPRRMSVETPTGGPTFIRDDFKAPSDSRNDIVRFLARANANRKIAVLGRISDHPGRSRRPYTQYAKEVASTVDQLLLVGSRPEDLWGRHRRGESGFLGDFASSPAEVHLFETVEEAARYLRRELLPSDLVLLKGSGVSDHLERVFLQFSTDIGCWKTGCGKTIACDECDELSERL